MSDVGSDNFNIVLVCLLIANYFFQVCSQEWFQALQGVSYGQGLLRDILRLSLTQTGIPSGSTLPLLAKNMLISFSACS